MKFDGTLPARNIFHQVYDRNGVAVAGMTNDPTPGTGTNHVFAELVVGASVSATQS